VQTHIRLDGDGNVSATEEGDCLAAMSIDAIADSVGDNENDESHIQVRDVLAQVIVMWVSVVCGFGGDLRRDVILLAAPQELSELLLVVAVGQGTKQVNRLLVDFHNGVRVRRIPEVGDIGGGNVVVDKAEQVLFVVPVRFVVKFPRHNGALFAVLVDGHSGVVGGGTCII
jgi:hypothetical protein